MLVKTIFIIVLISLGSAVKLKGSFKPDHVPGQMDMLNLNQNPSKLKRSSFFQYDIQDVPNAGQQNSEEQYSEFYENYTTDYSEPQSEELQLSSEVANFNINSDSEYIESDYSDEQEEDLQMQLNQINQNVEVPQQLYQSQTMDSNLINQVSQGVPTGPAAGQQYLNEYGENYLLENEKISDNLVMDENMVIDFDFDETDILNPSLASSPEMQTLSTDTNPEINELSYNADSEIKEQYLNLNQETEDQNSFSMMAGENVSENEDDEDSKEFYENASENEDDEDSKEYYENEDDDVDSKQFLGVSFYQQGNFYDIRDEEDFQRLDVRHYKSTATRKLINSDNITSIEKLTNVKRVMSIFTEEMYDATFANRDDIYTYQYFLLAIAKYPYFCNEARVVDADIEETLTEWCKNELSAFLAHVAVDSNMLEETRMKGCRSHPGDNCKCDYQKYCESSHVFSEIYPCCGKKQYYGRGAMNLKYAYNYGALSRVAFDDASILLEDPCKIRKCGYLAWLSAVYQWMTPQPPKPSMHSIMSNLYTLTEDETDLKFEHGFGDTINIHNKHNCGCGGDEENEHALQRATKYEEFLLYFDGSNILDRSTECRDQCTKWPRGTSCAYGNQGIYWKQDLSQPKTCKISRRPSKWSAIFEDDYNYCVANTTCNTNIPQTANTFTASSLLQPSTQVPSTTLNKPIIV